MPVIVTRKPYPKSVASSIAPEVVQAPAPELSPAPAKKVAAKKKPAKKASAK